MFYVFSMFPKHMGMFVYLSCDLRLIVDRRLLFVLLVYNMQYAIGRMSQVLLFVLILRD